MADLYFPVSTTSLSNAPTVEITVDNQDNLNVITLDERGFVGKTPLSIFREHFKITSLSSLEDIIPSNNLLGRYSEGDGPIELISLGEGLSVENGVLVSSKILSGEAGGDFEGSYPNPTIKNNIITLNKFKDLNANKLLGRHSEGIGEIEEISLSSDFSLANGELSLINQSSVSLMGFVLREMTDDFIAEPTYLYFINAEKNIKVSVPADDRNYGDQFIIINKSPINNIITIEFPNEEIIMDSLTKRIAHYVRDDENNYYDLYI